jgi:hypothetical protein
MWNSRRAGCALVAQSCHCHFSGGHVMNVSRRQFLQLAGLVAALPSQFLELAASAPSRPQGASALKYALGDKILCAPYAGMARQIYTTDGRFSLKDAETVLKTLRAFDPEGKGAMIDVTKT